MTKEEIEEDLKREKKQEEHWDKMKKERIRIFGDIITKDEVKDSEIGARNDEDFPVKLGHEITDPNENFTDD